MAFGKQGYNQTIACIRKQGTLYNTYTTSKSMLTSATTIEGVTDAAITLSPNFFYPEKKIRIRFVAGVSNRGLAVGAGLHVVFDCARVSIPLAPGIAGVSSVGCADNNFEEEEG